MRPKTGETQLPVDEIQKSKPDTENNWRVLYLRLSREALERHTQTVKSINDAHEQILAGSVDAESTGNAVVAQLRELATDLINEVRSKDRDNPPNGALGAITEVVASHLDEVFPFMSIDTTNVENHGSRGQFGGDLSVMLVERAKLPEDFSSWRDLYFENHADEITDFELLVETYLGERDSKSKTDLYWKLEEHLRKLRHSVVEDMPKEVLENTYTAEYAKLLYEKETLRALPALEIADITVNHNRSPHYKTPNMRLNIWLKNPKTGMIMGP